MRSRINNAAILIGWLAGLAAAFAVLLRLSATFPLPALGRDAAEQWFQVTAPGDIAAALLCAALLAATTYLSLVTAIALLSELFRWSSIERFSRALGAAPIRRLVRNAVGVSLVVAATTPALAPAEASAASAVEVSPYPRLYHVPKGAPPTITTTTTTPVAEAPAGVGNLADVVSEPAANQADIWRVSSGETLWWIADQTLLRRQDKNPTDREVSAFVAEIVKANRPLLADPTNPDLIFPGQEFRLPVL